MFKKIMFVPLLLVFASCAELQKAAQSALAEPTSLDIANGLKERIEAAHKDNKKFQAAFDDFMELCKSALNPNISQAAVDEMLIQHMLTIRLIAKIFTEGFTNRNVIAAEIEGVIGSLTSPYFNPNDFLGALDRSLTANRAGLAAAAI